MDTTGNISKRNIIPRWRPVGTSIAIGESDMGSVSQKTQLEAPLESITSALAEFKDKPTQSRAMDAVMAAIVCGEPERAREPARFLRKMQVIKDPSAIHLIERSLGVTWPNIIDVEPTISGAKNIVHKIRQRRGCFLHDTFTWLDLALAHLSLGNTKKADQSLAVARQLGGRNRLVMRAGTRFLQHGKKLEQALSYLHEDRHQLLQDPWLLAPEIGISNLAGKTSRFLKKARDIVDKGGVPPFHLSELAAAVGTAELEAGKHRKARKYFRLAVIQPSEQALAQTVWAQQLDNQIAIHERLILENSAEAQARAMLEQEKWRHADKAINCWLVDEPFATTPAALLSWLRCSLLDDFEGAISAAKTGLIANPQNLGLKNNLAFSLASMNQLKEASVVLNSVTTKDIDGDVESAICLLATYGFIECRSGNHEAGRQHYLHAIEAAKQRGNLKLMANATIFLARESARAGLPEAVDDRARAEKSVKAHGNKFSKLIAGKELKLKFPEPKRNVLLQHLR